MKKDTIFLIAVEDDEVRELICSVVCDLGFKGIAATNFQETRLKLSNQQFNFLILDNEMKTLKPVDFINGIRKQEKFKNIKDYMPVLLVGTDERLFDKRFSLIDNVKFMKFPFKAFELSNKIKSFSGKKSAMSEQTRKIGQGELLIAEGQKNNELYWVLEGGFEITKMNREGQEVMLGEIDMGELVGEMSFLDDLPRSANVRAKFDSEVLVIPHSKFLSVLDSQPRWFKSLMKTLSQRLRVANDRISQHADVVEKKAS